MHDIDLLLAQTDLPALADELIGGRKGSGRTAKWPSPVPGQQGTGDSPPMGIFTGRDGTQRWKDFSTGEGGTAIDLLKTVRGLSTKDALAELARRTNTPEIDEPNQRPIVRQSDQVGERPTTDGTPRINQYLEETNQRLDHPRARLAHRWLESHGITFEHAISSGVGYDPGQRALARPDWLPQYGPYVVMPVTDIDGNANYLTARNLRPNGPKYVNPKSSHATNPTISIANHHSDGPMILTEGVADALLLTQHGHNAAALVGTGIAAQTQWVEPLLTAAADKPIVLAFDNDPAGHTATKQATQHLTAAGAKPSVLGVPAADLGEWANTSGPDFANQLNFGLSETRAAPVPQPSSPALAHGITI